MTGRLKAPEKVGAVPEKAQWLTGEGGGAWFFIEQKEQNYQIKRFTPQGEMDCDRLFNLSQSEKFNENTPFEMQHISHCAIVKVKQNGVLFVFEWVGE